jgi:hypothetical protein
MRGFISVERGHFIPVIDSLRRPTETPPRERSNRLLGAIRTVNARAQSRYFHVTAPSKWRILQLDTTARSKLLALIPQVLRRRFFR